MEKAFNVKEEEVGQRLDLWLCKKFPSFSRKRIKAMLDAGQVRVGRRMVVIAGWKLEEDDRVVVEMSPGHDKAGGGKELKRKGTPKGRTAERAEIVGGKRVVVYYKDRDIIVAEKPAGIPTVHDGERAQNDSLINRIYEYLRQSHKESRGAFVAPLHRLDVGTSGVVVFALSNVGRRLGEQFRNHAIQREYTAILCGKFDREHGVIKKSLEKGDFHGGKKARTSHEGKEAVTEYRVSERYRVATMVVARVKTGRTHQIRVHFASEGHPLIGDRVYGTDGLAGKFHFHRHALHASSLGFVHPATGKKMQFRSPIPGDMRRLIDDLRMMK